MSTIFKGIPFIFTNSSIVSLVVPSISVTIALSSFKIAFNSEDFPAFGFPIITVLIPSFITLPLSNDFLPKIDESISFDMVKDEFGLNVSINGEKSSIMIGYRGDTLYALQNIISAIACKGLESRVRVILDVEGYKEKRKRTLEDLADKIENTVFKTKRSVTLEPMKSYERKIIHSKLQNSKKVLTHSIGEEPRRRVVISVK